MSEPIVVAPDPSWSVTPIEGPAAELHHRDLTDPVTRSVWVLTPDRPALVLGSTQTDAIVDPAVLAASGIDLVRRRSGGGAVLLDPHGALGGRATLWLDVVLPRDDRLWCDDVGRSMVWLGDAWRGALADLGLDGQVHAGALERSAASTLVCFAGLGPGEVTVGGRKVVGISQRRTRAGARFQCVVHVDAAAPEPAPHAGLGGSGAGAPGGGGGDAGVRASGVERIVELLRDPADGAERAALIGRLRDGTAAVPRPAVAVLDALLAHLPAG